MYYILWNFPIVLFNGWIEEVTWRVLLTKIENEVQGKGEGKEKRVKLNVN